MAFYPLTLPLTTGPGTIAVMISLGLARTSYATVMEEIQFVALIVLATLVTAMTVYICFNYADRVERLVGQISSAKPSVQRELLIVLDRPEIPLHTNTSENDVRCQVTRRKISGGTRSDVGRDCRDAFLGLAKTCAKLGIAFWDYLGSRLAVPGSPTIPYLPKIIEARARSP